MRSRGCEIGLLLKFSNIGNPNKISYKIYLYNNNHKLTASFGTGYSPRGVWYLVGKHFGSDLWFLKKKFKFAPAAPAVRENVYAYIVKNLQFWSDFAQIRDWNPFGSQMKISWKRLASRAPRAHSAWNHLRLFSEKSAILVRFRSNSGLEPLLDPKWRIPTCPQCVKMFKLI